MGDLAVVELALGDTYDLRRRVLRDGTPSDEVRFPEDDVPGTFHLGVRDEHGKVVAVATFCPAPTTWREGRRAVQLRGMAVDMAHQGTGVGRLVLEAAVARLWADGAEVLWAWARDSALVFYQRFGMAIVGDGWMSQETLLPHHTVVLDLEP